MPRRGSPYGPDYEKRRRRLIGRPCELRLVCQGAPATEADHVPPLSRHRHVEGSGCCRVRAACGPCQRRQAVNLANETRRGVAVVDELELVDPDGFDVDDPVWSVAWLDDLREVPADAVWPRFMTAPHPTAIGSLGPEFEWWCRTHRGITLRWWQRLVARRLLEVDADGRLVWLVVILTLARQLGKSWLLWLILSWRLHQGDRFGTPQRLLHMSIQMSQVRDVMDREIRIADRRPDLYDTLDNNNDTSIEWLADGSKWVRVVRGTARAGGAYGQSGVAVGVVDEAWSIPATAVDDGLEPTLVEGEQPWLVLTSTAHRLSTALMIDRRLAALDDLETAVEPVLIVEWSTPRHFTLDDVNGWRMASPWWTPQREQLIRMRVQRALSGFASEDDDEPDPIESVRAQWLNQWPVKLTSQRKIEALVDVERWAGLDVPSGAARRVWVAVADNFGRGAGVVAVADVGDGQFEVDGWTCPNRQTAIVEARRTWVQLKVPGELTVEPALATIAPRARHAVPADVRFGLPLLRELVESGRLVHDTTPELDQQLAECRVRPVQGGLALVTLARSDLVRAAALALRAAVVHRPKPAIR
jgi:hypothetical protein